MRTDAVSLPSQIGIIPALLVIGITVVATRCLQFSRRLGPLPPGPPGFPLVGNAFDMPSASPWRKFNEWSRKYNCDIIYLDLPFQPTLVIGSIKAAFDLLEGRSQIYSDRKLAAMTELMSWDFNMGLMPYSHKWRRHRKTFHEFFHAMKVSKYHPIQLSEARAFLRRALDSPSTQLRQNIRLIFTAIILRTVYDKHPQDMNDEYVVLAQTAVEGLSSAVPGAFWVDYFPFLRWIPSWVPGAQFKKHAEKYRPYVEGTRNKLFDQLKTKLENGAQSDCMVADLIQRMAEREGDSSYAEIEETYRNAAGIAYAAAADTTTSAAQSFLIGIASQPDVQKKAQAELDRVVGPNRLPDFDDQGALPYIQAVVLESMRWMPVTPLGVPRRVMTEDEYKGFRIPKGSVIVANEWAMLHDPEMYPHPEVFNPDRFMKDGEIDPTILSPLKIAFGFGRRICPGRHLSNNSLFITIASILHVFNAVPAVDDQGKLIDITEISTSASIVSSPDSVPCKLTPRSDVLVDLVRNSEA